MLLHHRLGETRTNATLLKVWAGPEEHGLINDDPAARRSMLRDPRLHLGPLQEITRWVVGIHQANNRCVLGILGALSPCIVAGPLILPVLNFREGIETVLSLWGSPAQQIYELTGAVAEDQLGARDLCIRVATQECGRQKLQLVVCPFRVMLDCCIRGYLAGDACTFAGLVAGLPCIALIKGHAPNACTALIAVFKESPHSIKCPGHRSECVCGDRKIADQSLHLVDVVTPVGLCPSKTSPCSGDGNALRKSKRAEASGLPHA
mmetsp:Transcript_146832/g.208119  ORF Transcript_146832/g.208119 Transcript_146832/m.208119 type:complete len:263 (+) Transcript_146832:1040-1828(+)